MRLHVLTAVSRPQYLSAVAESLVRSLKRAPNVDLTWHCRFDPERTVSGGQALKNEMLDQIADGFVWILDDDTVVHEKFFRVVSQYDRPGIQAIVVSQKRTDGRVLQARPENAVLGAIDAGQAVLRRELIADTRLPHTYAGDGEWLEELLRGRKDVVYLRPALSLHNVLSGVDENR